MDKIKNAGFTLLEILIALFIFTIVSLILVNALHSILTTQTSTEKHSERLAELQIAMTLIENDLEQTINRPVTDVTGSLASPVVGTEKDIALTHAGLANPLGQFKRSTLQRVRYRLDKNKLFRDAWEALDQTPYTIINSRQILSQVDDIYFQYLDQKENFQIRWPPPVTTDNPLPHAIQISIKLHDLGKITELYIVPEQHFDKPN